MSISLSLSLSGLPSWSVKGVFTGKYKWEQKVATPRKEISNGVIANNREWVVGMVVGCVEGYWGDWKQWVEGRGGQKKAEEPWDETLGRKGS